MSARGHSRRLVALLNRPHVRFASESDRIAAQQRNDAQCQEATYAAQQTTLLFDHLVGRLQEWLRDGEAKRLRSLEIDDEFVFRRLLDRKVTRFGTFEDSIDIASSLPEHVSLVRSIRNQSAVPRKKRKIVHCRQAVSIHQRDDCSAVNHVKAVWHRNHPTVWLARQTADGAFDVGLVVNLDHNRLDSE